MMRKLCCNKRKDFGAIGIGAMIVLIAMILVAGVAASVLVTTSNTLQSQALRTGSQTTREVSSGIRVSAVSGLVNTTESNNVTVYDDIWCLAITVEPRPGSDRIDLNNTFILLSDGDKKALLTYHYNDSDYFASDLTGNIFDTGKVNWSNLSSDKFGIGVLQDADDSISQFNPVLNRGDKAVLFIYTNTSAVFGSRISERKEIFGQVIPEIGSTGVISFTSPKAYVNTVYTLQ